MCWKNWLLQSASKKKMYTELMFSIINGVFCGLILKLTQQQADKRYEELIETSELKDSAQFPKEIM